MFEGGPTVFLCPGGSLTMDFDSLTSSLAFPNPKMTAVKRRIVLRSYRKKETHALQVTPYGITSLYKAEDNFNEFQFFQHGFNRRSVTYIYIFIYTGARLGID